MECFLAWITFGLCILLMSANYMAAYLIMLPFTTSFPCEFKVNNDGVSKRHEND